MPIVFACLSPHPPIILPSVGSKEDREKVKNTISALETLAEKLRNSEPDVILISSPHPDWGFYVPLYFLAKNLKSEILFKKVELETTDFYFQEGKAFYQNLEKNKRYALIASGDLSHCLKEDGPYGFHSDGPKFDKVLIQYLQEKNIQEILKLDEYFPQAGECGLRSFSFLLGLLATNAEIIKKDWQVEILSYEGPFGVGYLVANFKI